MYQTESLIDQIENFSVEAAITQGSGESFTLQIDSNILKSRVSLFHTCTRPSKSYPLVQVGNYFNRIIIVWWARHKFYNSKLYCMTHSNSKGYFSWSSRKKTPRWCAVLLSSKHAYICFDRSSCVMGSHFAP